MLNEQHHPDKIMKINVTHTMQPTMGELWQVERRFKNAAGFKIFDIIMLGQIYRILKNYESLTFVTKSINSHMW